MTMLSVSLDFPFLITPSSFSTFIITLIISLCSVGFIISKKYALERFLLVFYVEFGISVMIPKYSSYERTLFEHFYIVFYF